jgi:hypothetical protein
MNNEFQVRVIAWVHEGVTLFEEHFMTSTDASFQHVIDLSNVPWDPELHRAEAEVGIAATTY